jgi:putative two-component system response regulator
MRLGTIVVADDVPANVDYVTALLARAGYTVHTATDGAAALDLVFRELPDLVVTDVMMPAMNGFELCRRLKDDETTRLIPVVLVTSLGAREDRIRGIEAGADDFLTKPVNPQELQARVRSLIRLKRYTDDLDTAEGVILSLGRTVESRDRYTAGHCERLAYYATALGAYLDLPGEEVLALRRGAYLHDVGKIALPDAVLNKPGPLSADERTLMQQHPVVGDTLCGDLRLLRPVRPIVRHHHERLDGSGYPDRLAGDAVPRLAQIMGVVDVFDALTTDRVYRTRTSIAGACAELRHEVERGWRDRHLVDEFIRLCESGSLVVAQAAM